MATTALGVSPDSDGNGVTPSVHRHIIGGIFQNTGVIDGLNVRGNTGLTYTVDQGVAVCEKNSSDGKTLVYWPGGETPSVQAGDPTYPRIDVVWVSANNKPEYSDSDNYVHVGVTSGAPSANPVEPGLPDGCTKLMAFRLPAGATSTQGATQVSSYRYAIPFGGNLGELGENWWKQDMKGSPDLLKMFYEQETGFTVPTDRLIELVIQATYNSDKGDAEDSQWSVQFQIDNKDIPHAATNFVSRGAWETHQFSFITKVWQGHHTARLRTWLQHGAVPCFHYSGDSSGSNAAWVGRRFMIFDRGVAV